MIDNKYTRAILNIDKGVGTVHDFELLMKLAKDQGDENEKK